MVRGGGRGAPVGAGTLDPAPAASDNSNVPPAKGSLTDYRLSRAKSRKPLNTPSATLAVTFLPLSASSSLASQSQLFSPQMKSSASTVVNSERIAVFHLTAGGGAHQIVLVCAHSQPHNRTCVDVHRDAVCLIRTESPRQPNIWLHTCVRLQIAGV